MRRVFDNTKAVLTLDPEVYTGDTTGTDYVDSQGYQDGMLLIMSGDVTFTTAAGEGYDIVLYECDTTDGTYTTTGISVDVDDSNTIYSARIANLNTTRKRYLKAVLDTSATTTSWEGGVAVLLGGGDSGPVNND